MLTIRLSLQSIRRDVTGAYNYVWVADFYFQMYKITNDKQYAKHGYMTLRSMFKQFGHGFYAIGIPVRLGLQTLKKC